MDNNVEELVKPLTAPTIVFRIDRDDIDLESELVQEWRERIKQEAEVIINSVLSEQDLFFEFQEDFKITLDVDFEEGSIKVYIKHSAISLTLLIGICITGNDKISPETLADIHGPAVSKIENVVSEVTGSETDNEADEWSDPEEWKKHFKSFDKALFQASSDATFTIDPSLLMSLNLTNNEDLKTENYTVSWYLAQKKDSLEIIISVQNLNNSIPIKHQDQIIINIKKGKIEKPEGLEKILEAGGEMLEELLGCALLQLAEWLSHKFSEPIERREIKEIEGLTDEIKKSRGKILQKFFYCVNTFGLFVMGFK